MATKNRATKSAATDRSASRKRLYDTGLAIRKRVLGAEYVNKSVKNATDFNRPFQELVTEYCWGAVWVTEILLQRAIYCGVPAVLESFKVATKVIDEYAGKGKGK